jgi:hypothetical protein
LPKLKGDQTQKTAHNINVQCPISYKHNKCVKYSNSSQDYDEVYDTKLISIKIKNMKALGIDEVST